MRQAERGARPRQQAERAVLDDAVDGAVAKIDDLVVELPRGKARHQVDVNAQVTHLDLDVAGQSHQRVHRAHTGCERRPAGIGIVGEAVFPAVVGAEQREAEVDIPHPQTDRVRIDFVVRHHTIVVEVGAIGADADKPAEVGAANAEQVGGHTGAIGQHHILSPAFQTHRTRQLEEIADTQLAGGGGAHQHAIAAWHGQRTLGARAGDDVDRTGAEIDDLGIALVRTRALHQVEVHGQVGDFERQIRHPDDRNALGTGGQGGPAETFRAFLTRQRGREHQAEIGVLQSQAHGTTAVGGIGPCVDLGVNAISVGVDPIRTAHTGKRVQILAAKGQGVGPHLRAVGQRQFTGALLETHAARNVEELVHRQREVARGSNQRAGRAFEIQWDRWSPRGAGTDGHDEGRAGVIHHTAIAAGIDVHRHVAGLRLNEGQAEFLGMLGRGVNADPVARAGAGGHGIQTGRGRRRLLLVQGEPDIHPGQLKPGCRAVDRLVAQTAVMVRVESIGSVQTHEGLEVVTSDHPATGGRRTGGQPLVRDGHGLQIAGDAEHPVNRQEIMTRQRHAHRVVRPPLAEVRGVEEHAQLVGIRFRVRANAHGIGDRALQGRHRQAAGPRAGCGLAEGQHGAAVVIAKKTLRRAEGAADLPRADQRKGVTQVR